MTKVSGVLGSQTVAQGKFCSVLSDVPSVTVGTAASGRVWSPCSAGLSSEVLVCLGKVFFFLRGNMTLGCLEGLKFAWCWDRQ